MRRVLFFINSLTGGGAERVCLNLAEEMYKRGYRSEFITLYKADSGYTQPEYLSVFSLNIDQKQSAVKRFREIIKKIPSINQYIKRHEYKLITAHLPMSHFLASLTCVRNDVFYVMHSAQWPLNPNGKKSYIEQIRLFYRNKKLITVSEGIRGELIQDFKLKADNIKTIYNPVSLDSLRNLKAGRKMHNRPYIVSMGRLEYPKRPDLAVDLYAKGEFYRTYDLIFLGQGSMKKQLEEKIQTYGLTDNIYLMGFQKEPYQWLANAKLMLSISDSEALPMNIIEALACGTGVVAADCRYGPDEILTGELSKYLIDPIQDFSGSIQILKEALEDYPKIRDEYLGKFDAALIVERYFTACNK